MRFLKRRKNESRRDGCGFLILTCAFTCLLLVLNSALILEFYPSLADRDFEYPRVAQLAKFVGPVVLVFLEWWIADLAIDLVTSRRKTR